MKEGPTQTLGEWTWPDVPSQQHPQRGAGEEEWGRRWPRGSRGRAAPTGTDHSLLPTFSTQSQDLCFYLPYSGHW